MNTFRQLLIIVPLFSNFSYASNNPERPDDYFGCGLKESTSAEHRLTRLVDNSGRKNPPVPEKELDETVHLYSEANLNNLRGERIMINADLYSDGKIWTNFVYYKKQNGLVNHSPPFFLKPASEWENSHLSYHYYMGLRYEMTLGCIRATKKVIEDFFSETSIW